MSLILTGNSSTLTVDSTSGITFPYGSSPQVASSKVLQVVQSTSNTQASTTTAYPTYTATALAASITPLFSTSKILVLVNTNIATSSTSTFLTIYRNSTNLGGAINSMFTGGQINTSQWMPASMNYLDSPATTNSTTYTMYYAPQSGTAYANWSQATNTITLLEIAA